MKRLGEFRSKLRGCENNFFVYLSNYENGTIMELDIDMITDSSIFLRVIPNDSKSEKGNDREN